ncbi:uncharacterized protein LOC111123203 [Crassostrea virginica]|uniref:Large ribosomal subunit protein uL30m n=1 Tax=Crassostrea virginica TaxID=6565 RepID=A0A8B8DCQ0_CRAVI|nr:39S ribosomal protein L30, mitochondrial-like [Crassostrea virginica]XP_022325793.1 39S ribosomal protein L30, mitochondrial-like [Crassostrea virginica]
MAVFMQALKISNQLFDRFLPQTVCVRYKFRNRIAMKRNRKRREDMSWAAELLNYRNNVLKEQPEPSPLHLVTKIKPMAGRPKNEKLALTSLGFTKESDGKGPKSIIVKNTPTVNSQLKVVKHLLRITPITFPYGVPENEEDLEHCQLNENGEFIVVRNVTPGEEVRTLPTAPWQSTVWDMDVDTIKKHTLKIRQDMSLNAEFFSVDPVYTYNQDNKEYRYFGDKSDNGTKHFNERIDHNDGSKKES